ncbi:MAG TPA: S8 family serine peptidase [Dokdonella sp.]|nr:S8 family serine peptidase [Dokdonella sp.]
MKRHRVPSFRRSKRGLVLCALALACSEALAAEISPSLAVEADASGRVEALIVMPDQATPVLAPLGADADYLVRRRALVEALRARATSQQAGLVDWLRSRGIEHRAYWISNLVWARVSSEDLAALATRTDVARVEANPHFQQALPVDEVATAQPDAIEAIEYGVNKINAPGVWALGYTGQGVVIAGEDTGIRWDHAALKPHYRGWDGATADHNYNWHDSIHDSVGNVCGNDAPAPCDDNSHGTHTVGTFAGDDGAGNQIGVAPGAKWIGCRNMNAGDGTPARYIECMQWMLAPTDLAGQNPDPDKAPDVVSNSWGCIPSEGCTTGTEIKTAVDNVVAGGIFFAAAAANDGPGCGSITDPPAIYDSAFVVGATDSQDRMASFSSRGPVSGVARIRPDASAPGVNTRSATNASTTSYGTKSGTSMATPHVAGAAALLMSVNPSLKGHPDEIGEVLRITAVTAGVTDPSNSGCGGLTMADHPNYQVGWGRIDALAAAQSAIGPTHTVTPGVDGSGTVSPDAPQTVDDSDTMTFTVTPAADHHIVEPIGGSCPAGVLVNDTYTTGAVHFNCSIVARFAIDRWNVSTSAGANGTITPASQTVDAGTSATFTVTPDAGYVVAAVTGDTCNVTPSGASAYATDAIHADCAVSATFASDAIFDDGFDGP